MLPLFADAKSRHLETRRWRTRRFPDSTAQPRAVSHGCFRGEARTPRLCGLHRHCRHGRCRGRGVAARRARVGRVGLCVDGVSFLWSQPRGVRGAPAAAGTRCVHTPWCWFYRCLLAGEPLRRWTVPARGRARPAAARATPAAAASGTPPRSGTTARAPAATTAGGVKAATPPTGVEAVAAAATAEGNPGSSSTTTSRTSRPLVI